MSDESKNEGQGAVRVDLDVISTGGKHLKDLNSKHPWHSIIFTECMGLLAGETQFISGELVFADAINLMNEMQFSGDEIIRIKINTPGKGVGISFTGKVYNIDLADFDTKRLITLKFCSAEKLVVEQTTVNRAYRDVLYSDMAEDLFSDLAFVGKKQIWAEPTKNKGSFVVNNKNRIDVINTIKKVAIPATYNGSNYVFWETIDGHFRFTSIEALVSAEAAITYVKERPTKERGSLRGLVGIKNYIVRGMPNTVSNIKQGMYAGTVISNDLMKRQIKQTTFDYDASYNDYKGVNANEHAGFGKTVLTKNPTYSKRPQGYVRFVPKHFGSFDTEENHGDNIENTILVRNSQLQQINSIRLQITVGGDSQRRVGDVVKVRIPAIEEENDVSGGKLDSTLTGKYLVAFVQHQIYPTPQGYNTHMTLISDSWGKPLPSSIAS